MKSLVLSALASCTSYLDTSVWWACYDCTASSVSPVVLGCAPNAVGTRVTLPRFLQRIVQSIVTDIKLDEYR
jgi:hypothetical protein